MKINTESRLTVAETNISDKKKTGSVFTNSTKCLFELQYVFQSDSLVTTLNLGGDSWPIFLEPSGQLGEKGIKIDLEPGDMLVYSGCILEHWREQFEGENCGQVFLHYNNLNSQHVKNNKFDGREHLGLPSFCTK